MPSYKKPPVVEAVVEVRIGEGLDDKVMDRLTKKFSERYPAPPQPSNNVEVEFSGTALRLRQQNLGFTILSADAGFTVNLVRNAIGTSKNAPYGGWEEFIGEARTNWAEWVRVVGWKDPTRVGVRYINRIDIPYSPTGVTQLEDYLNLNINMPPALGPMMNFAMNAEVVIANEPVKVMINHAPTPSPLVQHNSFLLDIDLGLEQGLPANEKALWDVIERLRSTKNSIFEACITDRARELFS